MGDSGGVEVAVVGAGGGGGKFDGDDETLSSDKILPWSSRYSVR